MAQIKIEEGKRYFLYGRHMATMKKFRPINIHRSCFVTAKVHASIMRCGDVGEIMDSLALLHEENPGMLFELREAGK